jgi:adenylylsulfate kinase-like enzyme
MGNKKSDGGDRELKQLNVIIAGPSASGKTTLAKFIFKMLDQNKVEVTLMDDSRITPQVFKKLHPKMLKGKVRVEIRTVMINRFYPIKEKG